VSSAKGKVTLRFHGTDPAPTSLPLSFQCKLDGGSFNACASPKTYRHLKPRRHTVKVRARDASGNVDRSPAETSFRIS
jgi:large repetitive protein